MFAYREKISHDNVTGKLQLDFRPSDSTLLYGSVSLGVKSAGFNTGMLDETGLFGLTVRDDVPYDEEELTSYELGVKTDLFGGRSRFNASVFYYDYSDYQAFAFVNLSQVIFNTDATVRGMEIEFVTNPVEGLDILLGAALLDAEAKDIPLNDGSGVTRDRDMTLAPDLALNGVVRYEWGLGSGSMAGGTGGLQLPGRHLLRHPEPPDRTGERLRCLERAVDLLWSGRPLVAERVRQQFVRGGVPGVHVRGHQPVRLQPGRLRAAALGGGDVPV